MVSSAEVVRGSSVFDVSFLNSYVMAYHVGYNSSELAAMKVSKIQQEIALGSFETTLRIFAMASNATQLLNSTSRAVSSIDVSIESTTSAHSETSSNDGISTGALIGIILGVLGGSVLLCAILYYYLKIQDDAKKQIKQTSAESKIEILI